MREVLRLPAADTDLLQAKDWYETGRMGYGLRFLPEIQEVAERLSTGFTEHAIRFDDVRRVNLKRFPYALNPDPAPA